MMVDEVGQELAGPGTVMRGLCVPERYRGMYQRAMNGNSLRAAARAHCLVCMG